MKTGVFTFVAGLLACVQSLRTGSETVWLKDVTTTFQPDTRTLSDLDLPDQLTFHLRRGSNALSLNLERNYEIDPNTDIYVVHKLKDGRSYLAKTRNLEKEDVAYYQDRENGAFMTVRCFKRSSKQCDRVINGNIRIGDSSYDLRPAETDLTSRNLLDFPGFFGKRYVLQEHSVEKKDTANVEKKKVEQEHIALLRRFHRQNTTLSSRNVASLHNRGTTDKTSQVKGVYYVEVAVLIDSGIYNLFASTVKTSYKTKKRSKVKRKIRGAYSHIMNGVNMRYKEIEDPSISISVILCAFIFFQHEVLFPHKRSNVTVVNGKTYIDVYDYIEDLSDWDEQPGQWSRPLFDHAMLFTGHDLYKGSIDQNAIGGLCWNGGVCEQGSRTSVIQAGDYWRTVKSATHELGHSLGAWHDGEKDAANCSADDLFIMSSNVPDADTTMPYSRNPWLFSNCSVESFKKTLKNKDCVYTKGKVYNETEWMKFMQKKLGEVYTPNEQCHLINGPNSDYCGTVPEEICHLMRCTDPKTRKCLPGYFSAARGTKCGQNMWCIEGRCVRKVRNRNRDDGKSKHYLHF